MPGRPREGHHRGGGRGRSSEAEAHAGVVAALEYVLVVVVVAPLRVAALALAGKVGALHVDREAWSDVVAERGIEVAHRLVPDRQRVAPGGSVELAVATAAPVVGQPRLQAVLL